MLIKRGLKNTDFLKKTDKLQKLESMVLILPPYLVKNPEIPESMDKFFAQGTLALFKKNYIGAFKYFEHVNN